MTCGVCQSSTQLDLCLSCQRTEEAKGAAWARGVASVFGSGLERLQTPVTNITLAPIKNPTAEDGLRLREALEAAKRTYGGETP